MTANVRIDLSDPMAIGFLQYARTLPFATVDEETKATGSAWQHAIDEGAVTVDGFFDELDRRIEKRFRDA
jgi:hypothetical protein